MRSPFPGMDPYLEGSPYWQGFHNAFMVYAADQLQPLLPERYVAVVDVRSYCVENLEQREAFVYILALPERQLVTIIEFVSPENKRPGEGMRQYQRQQRGAKARGLNLVEVDLVRHGEYVLAAPPACRVELPRHDYLASVYRAGNGEHQLLGWTLREPLPIVPIPLNRGETELALSLQPLMATGYEKGAFHKLLKYRKQPPLPLCAADAVWAAEQLRAARLLEN